MHDAHEALLCGRAAEVVCEGGGAGADRRLGHVAPVERSADTIRPSVSHEQKLILRLEGCLHGRG